MSLFNKLQRNLWGLTKVAGLEITIASDGSASAAGVILGLKKEEIEIIKKIDNLPITELKSAIEEDVALALSFAGKGIIGKQLSQGDSANTSLVNKVIPNASPEDFYVQQTSMLNGIYLSLIRRENLDEYLDTVKNQGFYCIAVNLMGLSLQNLLPVLNLKDITELILGYHSFTLLNNEVSDYKYLRELPEIVKNNTISIGEDKVNAKWVVPYSLALQQLAGLEVEGVDVDKIFLSKKEYTQKKIFKVLGIALLSFFFVLLLVNYLIFSDLNDRNSANAYEAGKNKTLLIERDSLRSRTREMEKFLRDAGWQSGSKVSFFADEIGASVPKDVKLSKLVINPLNQSSIDQKKEISFKNGEIFVEGECISATVINPWLEVLKKFTWTKEVTVIDYKFNQQAGKGIFSIKIAWI